MSYTASYVVNSSSAQGTTDFQFTFPYIKEEHIEVYLNYNKITQGSGSNQYQVITNVSPKLIRLNTGISSANLRVEVKRNSSLDSALVDYADGSTLTANDLDTSVLQSLYIDQELKDNQGRTVTISSSTGLPTLNSLRLTDVADPTGAQDAATKNYVDTKDNTKLNLAGGTMSGAIAMGTNKITGAGDPTAAQDLSTKNYVDTKVFAANQLTNVVVTSSHITDGTIVATDIATGTLDGRYYTETELDAGQLDNRYYTETELNAGQLDTRYFTETECDARYFRQDSTETILSSATWSGSDAYIATTGAIDARIVDLVDDVGGFVPIANETSFPDTNPDVNNGAGTIVSIKALASNLTSNSSGVATIANGNVSNSATITINGLENSKTYSSSFGMLVETTSTLHTYTFHRQTPKATEVTTVAGISSAVSTVATNINDVSNFADIYQISSSAPTARSDSSSLQNGDLWFDNSSNKVLMVRDGSAGDGYAPVSPSQSVLNDIAIVSGQITYQEDLGSIAEALETGTGNNINTVATNIANVNTTAGSIANVNTTAGSISNVNTVGGAIANVNTVGASIADVNRYANEYKIANSAPSSPSAGDLWYDGTNNVLKYHNNSGFVGISSGLTAIVQDTGPALGGHLDCNDKNLTEVGTISGDNLQLDFGGLT
tara:strand:- start:3662 stop:5650 length:1989 start_codon:yes stop_codon:yes gene_type:complete